MIAHVIRTSSRFVKDRGPHADGEWRYQTSCTCGRDLSPWTTEVLAEGYGARHRFEVAA